MKRITKKKAKNIYKEVLIQLIKLDKDDIDFKLNDVVSGIYLGNNRYLIAMKGDWGEKINECVELNTLGKVVFNYTFIRKSKREYLNYDGDRLTNKILIKLEPYLVS